MAATVWKGHLTFGLVSIPVRLHRAARAERVSFRQLHGATSSRVKQVYVPEDETPETSSFEHTPVEHRGPVLQPLPFAPGAARARSPGPEPVPIRPPAPQAPLISRSELVKGYEYEKGRYVTISKEDLEKITPQTAREMEILEFVKLADIDPICFETSYYVTPEKAGERAYALLFEALRRTGYVAIAQFAMHNREHVVAIRTGRAGVILHTLFYETEIRREDEYETDTGAIAERELKLAVTLIESLAAPFDPAKYHDNYREKLNEMIAAKIAGEETVEPEKPKAKVATDIVAALERSLALARKPPASQTKPAPTVPKGRKSK